jgi:hypothetical protein
MGHIRLGTLPRSKKWRDVVELLDTNAPLDELAAAARASEFDLNAHLTIRCSNSLPVSMVKLPLWARSPEFERALAQRTNEASRIVEEFAGGWYGKTVRQKQKLDQVAINKFTRYALKIAHQTLLVSQI